MRSSSSSPSRARNRRCSRVVMRFRSSNQVIRATSINRSALRCPTRPARLRRHLLRRASTCTARYCALARRFHYATSPRFADELQTARAGRTSSICWRRKTPCSFAGRIARYAFGSNPTHTFATGGSATSSPPGMCSSSGRRRGSRSVSRFPRTRRARTSCCDGSSSSPRMRCELV